MSCRPAAVLPCALLLGGALTSTPLRAQTTVSPTQSTPPVEAGSELAPVTVRAQRQEGYTVDEATTATKLPLSPRETPQSVSVITRERIADQSATSLRDVLDNVAGIYSTQYDTERVVFFSRGFLIDTLLLDGVPTISSFTTSSIDESLDMAFYERVEIVRGATGLMTGAGNPGAAINLVRKHADSRTLRAGLDLTVGSWRARRAEADLSLPLTEDGTVRARVVAAAEDTRSYQDLYHKKKYVAYGIVDADLSSSTRVSLGFDYQDNRPKSVTWGSFPLYLGNGEQADWPRSVTSATDWSYWNRRTQTVFGEVRQSFDNDWQVRATLSRRTFEEDNALFYVFGYPDPVDGTGLDPYAYSSRGKVTENLLDVHASGPFQWLGRKHELVLGYNGSRAKNSGTERASVGTLPPPGNFLDWDGSYPRPEFADAVRSSDVKTAQDGVYLVGRFAATDTLKLIAGARYARWKVDSYYVYDEPADSKYDFEKLIPYVGAVWDVHPQYSLFASYTSIFKPQSSRSTAGRFLDPIDGRSYEVGLKGAHFDGRLTSSLTLFETRQNNVAAPVLDPETGEPVLLPDGSTASRPIDGTRTRGFEFELAGQFSREWRGSVGWARQVIKDGDGQAIRTFVPGTSVRLFLTWDPSVLPGLRVGGGYNWLSASKTTVGTPSGPTVLRQGSSGQVSLMARYAFTPNVSLQFNAENLLDKKYYVLDEYDNTYFAAPANYQLTLRLSY